MQAEYIKWDCHCKSYYVFLLIILLFTDAQDGGSKKFRDFLQDWPTPGTGPYFDTSINSNITGLVGNTVLLNCRVKNLGNRTVRLKTYKYIPE